MYSIRLNRHLPKADVSPSVALERGGYRMRAPRSRAPITPLEYEFDSADVLPGRASSAKARREPDSLSRNLTILLALLALSCASCFAFAYYLFTSRWEALIRTNAATQANEVQVIAHKGSKALDRLTLPITQRYVTYFPHSGLNNQRIALENALTLARLLNRKLLIPPIRLGIKPIRYLPFNTLDTSLSLSGNEGLEHCGDIPNSISLPVECLDYFDKTTLAWSALFDMSQIESQQSVILLPTASTGYITDAFASLPNGVLQVKDESPYQYQFVDHDAVLTTQSNKYEESISISELSRSPDTLLQLGTLFGTTRLALGSEGAAILDRIRQSMILRHPVLNSVVDSIVRRLPRSYFGLHLRVGDGLFLDKREETVQESLCRLLRRIGYSHLSTDELMRSHGVHRLPASNTSTCLYEMDTILQPNFHGRAPSRPSRPSASSNSRSHPIFISTDLSHPKGEPSLLPLQRIFPSLYFLSDFGAQLDPLRQTRNDDGIELYRYFVPLVEAMVVARAEWVVGTRGSTFSRFIEKTLWPAYHREADALSPFDLLDSIEH